MWLECINRSKKTAYIDKEKITITRISDKTPLHILSYEEIVKQVNAKNTWSILAMMAGTSYSRYYVSKSVLRPTHIRPKEQFSAVFAATLPEIENKAEQFKIEIDFAGDIHTFQIEQKKNTRKRKRKRHKSSK